jgi:hypothetical protein
MKPFPPAAADFPLVTAAAMLLQLATGQVYGPGAQYTTHPFATQPLGPLPYYAGTQQPCPQPAYPAQPPMGYPVNGTQQQQQQRGRAGPAGNVRVSSY